MCDQSRLSQLSMFIGNPVKLTSRSGRVTLGYVDADNDLTDDNKIRLSRVMRINLCIKIGDVIRYAVYSQLIALIMLYDGLHSERATA